MTVAPLFGRAWSGGPSARPAASTDLSTLQCDIIDAESALANAGVAPFISAETRPLPAAAVPFAATPNSAVWSMASVRI